MEPSDDDGRIDYSKFSRRDLEDALRSIDERRYPKNHANLSAVLRGLPAAPVAKQSTAPVPLVVDLPFEIAPKKLRFANFVIDTLAIYAFGLFIGILIGLLDLKFEVGAVAWLQSMTTLQEKLAGWVLGIVYYGSFECLTGTTLGKVITGTIVVAEGRRKPRTRQFVIRTFARYIPFEAFSFLGDPPRGWHDTLSSTYVIRKA